MSKEAHCDFCYSKDATQTIIAAPVSMGHFFGIEHVSSDNWAACNDCYDLIQSGNWKEITERAIRAWMIEMEFVLSDKQRSDIREFIMAFHVKLRKAIEDANG